MTVRLVQIATVLATAATLAACGSPPRATSSMPQSTSVGTAPSTLEYGRVSSIEFVPASTAATTRSPNVLGAVVGGVAGAALGRQIGSGTGRDAATVLGGVAGAAAGSQFGGRAPDTAATSGSGVYRVTVQTDQGVTRQYEVSATGDLRVGDRVRVENGVIYRS